MNENFKKAAVCVKGINTKATGMYGHLIAFALDVNSNVATGCPDFDMKPAFTEAEKLANAELKFEIGKNSTYRVVKNLICNCVVAGIALVDDKGKPRGKTDLEAELKAGKVKKPAIDRFKIILNSATSVADEIGELDAPLAAALAQDLYKKVAALVRLAA